MNVLLIGSGGREHALAWKIAQSEDLDKLYIAAGNAGSELVGTNVNIAITDFDSLADFSLQNDVNMIVVGSEEPLVKGIVDYFRGNRNLRHISIIGPSYVGAQLEGSKEFAKKFMLRHSIPTAAYRSFTVAETIEAQEFIKSLKSPYVLKADGLAAGKGVVITQSQEEAYIALQQMFSGKFGEAGSKVVIEEFLSGIELSVFVLTDGKNYVMLPEAKDYKRIGEADTGLNTGGMGAISPVPFANEQFMEKVENLIIRPTIEGLSKEDIEYKGFIFFGLINVCGEPMVIEYNVRLGDPETEVILPRIESDFLKLLKATADGNLHTQSIKISPQTATTVMLVSGGYPEEYEKGKLIENIENVDNDCIIFHAGTSRKNAQITTAGGRVIAVTALANDMQSALNKSNKNAEIIQFEGKYFRKDIGFDFM
jgi:phosphoribosylamine--glycine ligase